MKLLLVVAVLLAVGTISGTPTGNTGLGGVDNIVGCLVTTVTKDLTENLLNINKLTKKIVGSAKETIDELLRQLISQLKCVLTQLLATIQEFVGNIGKVESAVLCQVIAGVMGDVVQIIEAANDIVSGQDCDFDDAIERIQKALCNLAAGLQKLVKTVLKTVKECVTKEVTNAVQGVINALLCFLQSVIAIVNFVLCAIQKLLQNLVGIVIEVLNNVTGTLTKVLTKITPVITDVISCHPGALNDLFLCLSGVDGLLSNLVETVLALVGGLVGGLLGCDGLLGGGGLLGDILVGK